MGKPRNKAMKRNGTKARWSERSMLPGAVLAMNLHETVPHNVQVRRLRDIAREEQRIQQEEKALADLNRRRADRCSDGLSIESKDSKVYRKLSGQAMNAASMRDSLPQDSGAYPRQVVLALIDKNNDKQITYRTLYRRNGEGYKDALVFASGEQGFWYCVFDCERGSFVSEEKYTDRQRLLFEIENNIVRMRAVTTKERHFIIAINTRA